jgi:outer membrane protein TolC
MGRRAVMQVRRGNRADPQSSVSGGMAGRARRHVLLIIAAALAAAAQPAAAGYLQSPSAGAALELERQNVKLIADTLREASRQYAAGVITATDVAQVEARLALARSSLAAAEAQYAIARANYLAAIGVEPGEAAGTFRHKSLRRDKKSRSLEKH